MTYVAADDRYSKTPYRRCGRSGVLLPEISLGLWQNFGDESPQDTQRAILRRAFDLGVTHFDLANNYGPPYGSAEINFGRVMREDLRPYRDELIISTKAGYDMWPGPYGEWGSRKYLLASLDQSLRRMGLEYVDIFYSHRFDPDTPLEETMGALDTAVRSGKALYAGISSYSAERTMEAVTLLRQMGIRLLIHQPSYSMLNRWIEGGLLEVLGREARDFVLDGDWMPDYLAVKYADLTDELLDEVEARAMGWGGATLGRILGDCHRGNILWTDLGPHFVDLDDCLTGPAVQDLWMLLSGGQQEMRTELHDLLKGYEQFLPFDRSEIALIEPLRALRMIHYSAWLARRWHDPAFPRAFPWFAEPRYWEDHYRALDDQLAAVVVVEIGVDVEEVTDALRRHGPELDRFAGACLGHAVNLGIFERIARIVLDLAGHNRPAPRRVDFV